MADGTSIERPGNDSHVTIFTLSSMRLVGIGGEAEEAGKVESEEAEDIGKVESDRQGEGVGCCGRCDIQL
jgi:hypothetical protein